MTLSRFTTAAALSLALTATATADPAGLKRFELDMPHHAQLTGAVLWYPAGSGGTETVFADNPVFQGVTALEDAEVTDGTHPVVLMSHGMGGGNESTAWLASALAERGAIVIGVNHLNTTWRAFDMSKGIAHWTRAQDLSYALDVLMDDPAFHDHIDPTRVMAAGFSYGGWTALSLGGARSNRAGAITACEEHAQEMELCDLLMSPEVDLPNVDAEAWNASYADPRVTHVAALDPGFVWGPSAADVSEMVQNVSLIGLGDAETRLYAADFDRSGFAELLPNAEVARLVPAVHFTGMPLCRPAGAAILAEEKDDPVCTDPDGADRAAVHQAIIDLIATQIGL